MLSSKLFLFILMGISAISLKAENTDMYITNMPLVIESGNGSPYYILPAGTMLYYEQSYPEGFTRYRAYFNYKGLLPADKYVSDKINLKAPQFLGDIDEARLKDMLTRFPLSKADVQSVIKANGLTKADLAEIMGSLPD
jgi:hypothetical protein